MWGHAGGIDSKSSAPLCVFLFPPESRWERQGPCPGARSPPSPDAGAPPVLEWDSWARGRSVPRLEMEGGVRRKAGFEFC